MYNKRRFNLKENTSIRVAEFISNLPHYKLENDGRATKFCLDEEKNLVLEEDF